MLDENLPTFLLKPSTDKPKFNASFHFLQHGAEPLPAYTLRHLDPALPASKNRYAAALYDSFTPDVVYAEVLLIPKWTQPSLSQEAIRLNGGVAPPPEPILPQEFVIQLYNPDQQVLVRHKPKTWNSAASWEFEMPQQTFRQPSNSALDRTMSDPAASEITPKLKFTWKKDGKLSKDLGCYMSGKRVDSDEINRKHREPDITVAIFRSFKEVTLYEPNLYRVEMEDFKGLEVVLLLGAIVIRDVYFGQIRECFHISDPPKPNSPVHSAATMSGAVPISPVEKGSKGRDQVQREPQAPNKPPRPQISIPQRETRPPPVDPRTQWELDQETARLKAQADAEAKERRRRGKEAEKETKRLLEAEQREARRRQAAIDQETERLKKIYGKEEQEYHKQHAQTPKPNLPPRRTSSSHSAQLRHSSYSPSQPTHLSPYSQAPPGDGRHQSSVSFLTPRPNTGAPNPQLRERRSIFGLFKKDDDRAQTLAKKRSSVF
ncbi:hypothetical protein FQN55_002922 [Onygenales sp. PD_40]|nr:hypothetical protein FQN55_002922 [Onygenales sp. PD_40]